MKEIVREFKILEKIGSGGMGDVFKASASIPGNNSEFFALKRLSLNADEQFENELELLSKIDHENVCKVFGFCKIDGIKYIVMEYIDGITLSEVMRLAVGCEYLLPIEFINQIYVQLTTALNFIHTENKDKPKIIQCDLTPHNVIINKNGVLKVIDFGIGRELKENSDYTKTINFAGKVPYTAPEIFEQGKYSIKSDLYSLGVILFELSTNQLLFSDLSISEAINLKTNYHVPPVEKIRDGFPKNLSKVIELLLSKDPEKRSIKRKYVDIKRNNFVICEELQRLQNIKLKNVTLKVPLFLSENLIKNRVKSAGLLKYVLIFVIFGLSGLIISKYYPKNDYIVPTSAGHEFVTYENKSVPIFDYIGCRQLGIVLLSDFDILIEGTKHAYFNGAMKRTPYDGYTQMMSSIETTNKVLSSYSVVCRSYEQWEQIESTIKKWYLIFNKISINPNIGNKEYDNIVTNYYSDFHKDINEIERYTSQLQFDRFKLYINVENDFIYLPSTFDSTYIFSPKGNSINYSKFEVSNLVDILSLNLTSQWYNTQKPSLDKNFSQTYVVFSEKQNNPLLIISKNNKTIEFSADMHGPFCIIEKTGADLKSKVRCYKDKSEN